MAAPQRPLLPLLALSLLWLTCAHSEREDGPAPIFFAEPHERPSNRSRCFIVKVRENVSVATVMEEMRPLQHGAEGGLWESALPGFYHCVDDVNETRLAEWANDTRVEFVEEDRKFRATAMETVSSTLWNLDRIDQRSLPLNNLFVYNYTGQGVYIYVVDTGVLSTHEQLLGRVQAGQNFVSGRNATNTSDCNGHGTHVSGTAAGSVTGVAKGATIVPVRVLDCDGEGTSISVINALNWIASGQPKPGVINLSLGSSESSAVDAAVEKVVSRGYHVVAAAGNSGDDACQYSPARVSSAITVGWTTSQDAMDSLSSYGSCVDLFAPGSDIFSSWYTGDSTYALESGTSMSTALTSGVVAAYLQANASISPTAMQSYIKQVATSNVLTGLGTGSPNLLLFSQGNSSGFSSSSGETSSSASTSDSSSNNALYWILVVPAALVLGAAICFLSAVIRHRCLLQKAEERAFSQAMAASAVQQPSVPLPRAVNSPSAVYGIPIIVSIDEQPPMVTPQSTPREGMVFPPGLV